MTLIVHAYVRAADGPATTLAAEPPRNDLAGPESWRVTVYGSNMTLVVSVSIARIGDRCCDPGYLGEGTVR